MHKHNVRLVVTRSDFRSVCTIIIAMPSRNFFRGGGILTWILHSVIHSLLSVEWVIVDVGVQFPESRGS